jgi:2-phosphosulfolactate phosphatase
MIVKITISEFFEGAREAKGLTVVIDVFRAFSVGCFAIDSGAVKLIATGESDKAFELKKIYKQAVLVGERDERKIKGFDLGNSPTEILKADLKGKIVIHTTTAGTRGLINAEKADTVITGSFVNAAAVSRYIRMVNPDQVTLVAMGYRAKESAEEDLLCARYIESMLNDKNENFKERIEKLRFTTGKRFFIKENIDFSPPTDFFLCTMMDKFSFILKAVRRLDGNIDLERIDV